MIAHYRIRKVPNILEADDLIIFRTVFWPSSPLGNRALVSLRSTRPFRSSKSGGTCEV